MSGSLRGKATAATGIVLAVAFLRAANPHLAFAADVPSGTPHAAKIAIRYAEDQIGKPYLWGGTGPDAYDCSGLVYMAYGARIPRTSQLQWACLPHIPASRRGPGDLVFFAGSDGTPASPGHVGLLISRNRMVEAYAAGFPVRITVFGKPSSPLGDQNPVGFADPAGR